MKRSYESPALSVVGSLVNTTGASQDGQQTDQIFPANTPRGELTFS